MGEAYLFGNGGGGSGFTVTVYDFTANEIVTARHGSQQKIVSANSEGVAVFEKLSKGVWVFTANSLEQPIVAEILSPCEIHRYTYLFKNGDQCTDITGGWNLTGWSVKSGSANIKSGVVDADRIKIYGSEGYNTLLSTYQKIPILGTTICVQCNVISTYQSYPAMKMQLNTEKISGPTPIKSIDTGNGFTGSTIIKMDTSDLAVEEAFVVLQCGGASNYKTDVSAVWLESYSLNPSPNSLIICTAPLGSTVTATNGTTTFKAEKTLMGENEIYVFSIKPEYFSASPITVTCAKADGTSTTQDAVIDSKKDVELNFNSLYFVKNGILETAVAKVSGLSGSRGTQKDDYYEIAQTATSNRNRVIASMLPVRASTYSKITLKYMVTASPSSFTYKLGVATNNSYDIPDIAYNDITATPLNTILTATFPLSAVSANEYYISGFFGGGTIRIYDFFVS